MRRVILATMLWTVSAVCQTPAKEPDTIQALLAEVHQLRQAIEGITVASQRVQIALYALQMQDAAVARAAQRLDSVRSRCSGAEENRLHTSAEIQRLENALVSRAIPAPEADEVKQRVATMKSEFDAQTAQLQSCQTGEAEASTQLRNDQSKLLELQDRITRLDKALEQFGGSSK